MDEEQRPTWDEYFKKIVLATKERAACERLQVGCLLVKDNRIISQGYNGYLSGAQHTALIRDGHNIGTIHAEQNAVLDCARRGVSCNKTTAYITHYPCFNCIKFLAAAGIKEIKYINDYHNDKLVNILSEQCKVNITKI